MKLQHTAILALGLVSFQASAQAPHPTPTINGAPVVAETPAPDMDKVHTALGMFFGGMLKRNAPDINVDKIAKVMKDVLAGKPTGMEEKDIQPILMTYSKYVKETVGKKNKAVGEAFLAENAKKAGVVSLTNGVQYLVITEGAGESPTTNDTVMVNYKGTFIDGTEFDSSKAPFEVRPNSVINGWQDVLPLMKVGSKWRVFIPASRGYGENGSGQKIPGNSVLIFEMELVSIKAPPAEVSGEIIKVPSADELKKGAKIEVINPAQSGAKKK